MKTLKITVFRYSLQLFLSALYVRHSRYVYFSLVGGILPYVIKHTRTRILIDNILFLVSLRYNLIFFLSYGFTIVNTYKSVRLLCLSDIRYHLIQFVFIFEILGYIVNFIYAPNYMLGVIFAILQFANIFTLITPPIEEDDFSTILKKIRYLIDNEYVVRSKEYKEIIKIKNKTSTIKYVKDEKNLGYEEYKDMYISDSVPEDVLDYVEKDKKEKVLKDNLFLDFITPVFLLPKETTQKLYILTLSLLPTKKYDFLIFFFAFLYILDLKTFTCLASLFTNFSCVNNYNYLRIFSLVLFFYFYKTIY